MRRHSATRIDINYQSLLATKLHDRRISEIEATSITTGQLNQYSSGTESVVTTCIILSAATVVQAVVKVNGQSNEKRQILTPISPKHLKRISLILKIYN